MPPLIVWLFLFIATLFAATHKIAVAASLYWYYSWFDIVMHFWGGLLIALGVRALTHLKLVKLQPTLFVTVAVLLALMISWEVFEFSVGLWDRETYVFDTAKDLLVGFSGGVIGFLLLKYLVK